MYVDSSADDRLNQAVQGCGITGDFSLELHTFGHRHDGDAMHGNGPADQDFVAHPGEVLTR
jgi:hypothetical protein